MRLFLTSFFSVFFPSVLASAMSVEALGLNSGHDPCLLATDPLKLWIFPRVSCAWFFFYTGEKQIHRLRRLKFFALVKDFRWCWASHAHSFLPWQSTSFRWYMGQHLKWHTWSIATSKIDFLALIVVEAFLKTLYLSAIARLCLGLRFY